MPVLVVGSVAFDTVETPYEGKAYDLLGGSATYFAFAASLFVPVHLISVVGSDFPRAFIEKYERRGICTKGLQIKEGHTFRWWGKYLKDLNERQTLEVELNVFQDFQPRLLPEQRRIPYLFLANSHPLIQHSVLSQMEERPKWLGMDTMDLWIQTQRPELLKLLQKVDMLLLNAEEAQMLAEEVNLYKAARRILRLGPKVVVVKKGEHGSLLVSYEGMFLVPAYPLERVVDPTGAGDSFAGGVMGYLAKQDTTDFKTLKRAMLYGSVVASFTVEEFGPERLEEISLEEVENRLQELLEASTLS